MKDVSTTRFPRQPRRWSDWSVEELLAAKDRSGTTVSLVLPARDEADTVAGIVTRVRRALVDEVPLVDEIVVIDSDSSDATAEVARAAGATVVASSAIRPDLGTRPGKGEAMWKAMFATTGDVLVFMDADLTEWDTHFVTGLLGPLLTDDEVELVKGFYDRPLGAEVGGSLDDVPSEGGRVTELVARPLLALHWPELAGIVQPLAGEWAVRRSLFEQLGVPGGYAVELGVLVDAYETRGLGAIAQVDLGLRKHGHQGLRDLGVMSLQILAMAQSRVARRPGTAKMPLRQFEWSSGTAAPALRTVDLRERPPAVSVPGYVGVVNDRGASSC